LIAVQVVGLHAHGLKAPPLFRAFVEPQEGGATEQKLQVPITADMRTVCAEARYVELAAACLEHIVPSARVSRRP
jgi:hypothetical protein